MTTDGINRRFRDLVLQAPEPGHRPHARLRRRTTGRTAADAGAPWSRYVRDAQMRRPLSCQAASL
ncbi:hypothetical protein ACFHW2_29505 [Actinomadura sp. LOL_016]|uniref:hypothetical protein n=1 Tax=unclassified Actinomadura TaxID=2626254 RepID=UPI003A809F13